MRLDIPFFLGLLYAILGAMVLAGWIWTRDLWNLYGGLMLLIGLVLVWRRPKPPLRFFLGRIRPDEKQEADAADDGMDMQTTVRTARGTREKVT